MNKYLLTNSKKIICLALLASAVLISNGARAQKKGRNKAPGKEQTDTVQRGEPADSLKAPVGIAPSFAKLKTIPVLYGEQLKSRLVQAVGYLEGKNLETSPVTLLSNAFAGQLAGLNVIQTNGAPRFDNPTLSLRGRSPLIVVDGVPRYNLTDAGTGKALYDVLNLNPEQVESVILLKDALSTVMLGNRSMNGVLMINTRKQGVDGGSAISIKAQTGIQSALGLRKTLSSYNYATLYNEAAVNSGMAPVYSQAQLDGYRNGTDPQLYPNVDWQNVLLNKTAPTQRYNVTAQGNYTNVKYFLTLDYQSQLGFLKEPADSIERTNVDYKRYIARGNIELKLDKRLTAFLNVQANIQDFFEPGPGDPAGAPGYTDVFNGILNTPNNATPILNANGTFAGSRLYPNNPYAEATATGHYQYNLQQSTIDMGVKRMTDDLVKGTWLKALVSYNPAYEQQIQRTRSYNAYNFPVAGDVSQAMRVNIISQDRTNASTVTEKLEQSYAEFSAGIDRSWNKSVFTGIVLGNYNSIQSNNQLTQVYKTLSTRIAYSYNTRFNLEAAAAYSGNNWYAPGKQYGFYPAVGASWNINNESFFKQGLVNELKLRASYGKVANANPGYYLFRQTYADGTDYVFSAGATPTNGIHEGATPNPDRTTEKANKLNIGIDLTYSNQRGWLNVEYYNNSQYDLLQPVGMASAVLGQTFPDVNIGRNKYYGFEFTTGWADKAGKLSYSISGNLSTVSSRVLFNDEPAQPYAYQLRTGYSVNQIRGYVFDGLFNSSNLNSPTMSGFVPVAGDAKYKDLNNDGVINTQDQTVIGNNKPLLFFGTNLSLKYGGFDMNILIQGVANRDIMTTGNYEFPFTNNGKGQAFEYNLNRYTPQTAATATLPRVVLGTDFNNYIASSLFVRNASFLRLENAELGYSFSLKFLSAIKVKQVRLFVNGQNLLTYSKYKESDPENYTGLYPLQRFVNGGLIVKL